MTPDPSLQGAVERLTLYADWLADPDDDGNPYTGMEPEGEGKEVDLRTILAALPEPPAEDADAVGCAEREVGRAIYERIEALMSSAKDATPEGRELSYLADLVASVEEYGSWNGPTEPIAVPDDVIEVAARTHYNHHYGPEGWDSLTDRARRRLTFRMRAALPEPPSKSAESGEREKAFAPDTDGPVNFYERDFYPLSNFSSFKVRWGGRWLFDTSEALYHWLRFSTGDAANSYDACQIAVEVASALSAHEAFRIAQDNKHLQRSDWPDVKVGFMREIVRTKAVQHEYVRRKLLATGGRLLIEGSWRDDFWGVGPNGDGQNMLGKLWMELRDKLLAAAPKPPEEKPRG